MPEIAQPQDEDINRGALPPAGQFKEEGDTPETPETPEGDEEKPAEPGINDVLETLKTVKEDLDSKITGIEEKVAQPQAPVQEEEPKEWAPKNWGEVVEKAKEMTKAELAQAEAERAEAARAEQEMAESIDREFDNQIDQLEKRKLIAPVADPNDPNDPGRAARRELFGYAAKLKTVDLIEVQEALDAHHRLGEHFDFRVGKFLKTNTPPAGATAPIASGQGTTTPPSGKPDYATIHGARGYDELIEKSLGPSPSR